MTNRKNRCSVLLPPLLLIIAVLGVLSASAAAPLIIKKTELPEAFYNKPYRFRLQVEGGVYPLRWRVERGSLPAGMRFDRDGILQGTPTQPGEFHFTVAVIDSSQPPFERKQAFKLIVRAPLFAQWSHYPQVSGRRIDGSVKVSNNTGSDFDLTFVVLAVNEIGRATAIGYQHFTLKKGTLEMELPFGDELPHGSYQVNVDVVGEIPAANAIYRTHLVTSKNLEVTQGP